jgi:hypothetical protein
MSRPVRYTVTHFVGKSMDDGMRHSASYLVELLNIRDNLTTLDLLSTAESFIIAYLCMYNMSTGGSSRLTTTFIVINVLMSLTVRCVFCTSALFCSELSNKDY